MGQVGDRFVYPRVTGTVVIAPDAQIGVDEDDLLAVRDRAGEIRLAGRRIDDGEMEALAHEVAQRLRLPCGEEPRRGRSAEALGVGSEDVGCVSYRVDAERHQTHVRSDASPERGHLCGQQRAGSLALRVNEIRDPWGSREIRAGEPV